MFYSTYETPVIGTLTLASDGETLCGCWFEKDRYFGYGAQMGSGEPPVRADDLPVFIQTKSWLDRYFAGEAPDARELPMAQNLSPFQLRVREAMLDIPYGHTRTYGDLAARIAAETGQGASARAVGGAVGKNPLCVIVPCHRVMGAGGNLTGFGGGLDFKVALLEHEGVDTSVLRRHTRGTALVGIEGAEQAFFGQAAR